jgi:hypothetical protein
MRQDLFARHFYDEHGNPAGGTTYAPGLCIGWQHGPLGRGAERRPPNGCFVETVIAAAMDRLDFYQRGKFACDENAEALKHLQYALQVLNDRTARREAREVEGTHTV